MTPFIIQGILSFEKSSTNCIVFNKQVVLAPGSVLEDYVRNSNSSEILESIVKNRPIVCPENKLFTVKFRDKKTDLEIYEVQLVTGVLCTEIHDLLESFIPDLLDNISRYLKSYFLVLKVSGTDKVSVERIFLNYLRESRDKLKVLDDVLTVSTPFNNEAFYSTVHLAKIANVKKQILFVLSNSMPKDCEGCPVFNRKL